LLFSAIDKAGVVVGYTRWQKSALRPFRWLALRRRLFWAALVPATKGRLKPAARWGDRGTSSGPNDKL